jgi:uncharacterized protein (TIGR03437 family)
MEKLGIIAILLFYVPLLPAQTPPNWTQEAPKTSPSARQQHAMAYDSVHGQVVLFGGLDADGNALNDTWTWDGSNWTQQSPQTSPSARFAHTMAYNSTYQQLVLFGGTDASYNAFNDTWLWDGANWTQKVPETSPLGRSSSAMVSNGSQLVLFGGFNYVTGNALNDIWTWNGVNWTQTPQNPATGPVPRYSFAMAYDSTHSQIVVFGGSNSTYGYLGDTWLWNGGSWTEVFPLPTAPTLKYGEMVYDAAYSQAILFGGSPYNPTYLNQTWAWDGSTWMQQSFQTNPAARVYHAMAYESASGQALLFGGSDANGDLLGDTWSYGVAPPPVTISGAVSASAFGGFSSAAPGSWVEIYGSNLAPDTQGWTGSDFTGNNAPTSLNGVSVSIGGQAAFVDYISATQVNAQLPSNIATGGTLPLTVTNANATSAAVNLTVNPTAPGLLAPPSFKIGANQYVVAQHSDGTYVLPIGAISGVASSPAKPGETVVIYGVGFGPVIPDILAGEIATEANQLADPLQILFEKTPAQTPYYGLAPNFVGLYQFNVTVPSVANNELVPLTFSVGGVVGTQILFTAVHQ